MDIERKNFYEKDVYKRQAVRHPEWLIRNADESTTWVPDFTTVAGFHRLCTNNTYLDMLVDEIEEVMQLYDPCGVFLDITGLYPCYCANCRREIEEDGVILPIPRT